MQRRSQMASKIYLAAPLFNERERAFNAKLSKSFEAFIDVFLPQRDGLLLVDLLAEGYSLEIAETLIFERDRSALLECDILIAILDGAHIDEGVAFEIGFASARGCLCLGIQTDSRRALPTGNNPMIGRSLSSIFASAEEAVNFLKSLNNKSDCANISQKLNLVKSDNSG